MAEEEGIMIETRRLLNNLNEENSQLRERNHDLQSQCREARDATVIVKREKESLERDLKQINLNLMQQLQSRANKIKELESALADSEHANSKMRVNLSTKADDDHEHQVHIETLETKVIQLEAALVHSKKQHEETADELHRTKDDLKNSMQKARSSSSQLEAEMQSRTVKAEESIKGLNAKVTALTAELEEAQQAFRVERSEHHAEVARLTIEARRTAEAESNAQFTHDQLHAMADMVHRQLGDLHDSVCKAKGEVDANGASLHAAMNKFREQESGLKAFQSCDESVMAMMMSHTQALENEVSERQLEAKFAAERQREAEAELKNQLDVQRRFEDAFGDLQRRCDHLENAAREAENQAAGTSVKLSSCEADLREASAKLTASEQQNVAFGTNEKLLEEQIHSLKSELARQQSDTAKRTRSLEQQLSEADQEMRSMQTRFADVEEDYRSQLHSQREQLSTHAATLSAALTNLSVAPAATSKRRHHDTTSQASSYQHRSASSERRRYGPTESQPARAEEYSERFISSASPAARDPSPSTEPAEQSLPQRSDLSSLEAHLLSKLRGRSV